MAPHPLDALLSRFNRDQLATFIEVAIDLLDIADGDIDLEPNGDELDGTNAEDELASPCRASVGATELSSAGRGRAR